MSRDVNGVMVPDDDVYAFPFTAAITGPTGTVHVTCAGMTLRDWFAGHALPAMLHVGAATPGLTPANAEHVAAKAAYNIADAMMRARGGK